MALFGSSWIENDYDFSDFFTVDVEAHEELQNKFQQVMLNSLRPKMTWIQKSTSYTPAARFYCSNCGNDEMYKTPFCPICGAMEVKE